jgi:arylsulfatase A-like enzyme
MRAGFAHAQDNRPIATEHKPNVVFILADNVGYGDMGPYGGGELRGYPTPRVDQFAREGLRFTQYLVEPGCTPSRAALMTGQYSIRNRLSLATLSGRPNTLPAKAYTMDKGYATAQGRLWPPADSHSRLLNGGGRSPKAAAKCPAQPRGGAVVAAG